MGSEAMQVSYLSRLVWNLWRGGFCNSHHKINPLEGWVLRQPLQNEPFGGVGFAIAIDKKKPNLFHSENLASLALNTSRKMFMLAKFYGWTEHENSLLVLRNWLKTGDGSWFSHSHLEFLEIKELSEAGRVQALKLYAMQPLRYGWGLLNSNLL
jgi:hypothetical protein